MASLAALGSTLVPHAIRRFREANPTISVTLHIAASTVVRELVAGGQFSIGLAADEVDLTGVEHRVFNNPRAVCAIPPGHRLAAEPVIRPAMLDGEPFIALAAEDRTRQRLDAILAEAGARPRIVVETIYSQTICALALEGVGIGVVNPASTDGFAERGLVLRPFEPAVWFKAYLLFRPDAQKALLVKRFVAELLKARDGRA